MPFVHDETQVEWPDDGGELPPPRADQFVYIAAAEFGGGRAPVRFDVPSSQSPLRSGAPEQPSPPSPAAPAELGQEKSSEKSSGPRSFLQRLFGRPQPSVAPSQTGGWLEENRERTKREWAQRWTPIRSIVTPALQQIGGRRVYCRYDGGNDEGFAWFDSLELHDGQRIDLDTLAQRLHDIEVHASLRSAGVDFRNPYLPRPRGTLSEQGALKEFVGMLCYEWAALLLGTSFGTGEFSMFGSFTVDLETCIITDDPRADPVVQNISISR